MELKVHIELSKLRGVCVLSKCIKYHWKVCDKGVA